MRLTALLRRVGGNLVVALVAFALVAVALGFTAARLLDDGDGPSASDAAVTTARDFALAVTTFDYRAAEASIERVLAFGDAGFEAEFRAAMGDDFLARLTSARSISTGRIVTGPAVQTRVGREVSFLVVVDQTIVSDATAPGGDQPDASTTSTSTPAPQVLHLGLLVTVDDDTAKVTAVEIL